MQNPPLKKENNPNELSGYTSSALNKGPEESYTSPEENYGEPKEDTWSEKEDKQEKRSIKPARPKRPEYQEPEYSPQPVNQQPPAPTRVEIPPAPVYPEYPPSPPVERIRKEEMEALIEQIIEEKWDTLTSDVGDINIWKERVRTEVISIKQELLRLEHRFEEVNKAVLGKVAQYDKSVRTVGTDVKALEKVFKKILQPLTTNIKELQRVTDKLKK